MTNPTVADNQPISVELEAGREYWWCACGRSATQPFCDGSHKDTGFEPLRFVPEKSGKAWLCMCKHSRNPPYCDGCHIDV